MIIDFHCHVGDLRSYDEMDRQPVTLEGLISYLDEEEIDKAVFLPVNVSPELFGAQMFFTKDSDIISQLERVSKYKDRIIMFGTLDPRMGCRGNLEPEQIDNPPLTDFSPFLRRFKEMGCVGIGEITANLPIDDLRVINMFQQCGEWNMPVLYHSTGPGTGVYGLSDTIGSPGLEKLLNEAPETTVIGHAQGFWSEISGDIIPEHKFIYPEGSITKEGSLQRLLRTYPQLYADISANSGFNAISRDREYGIRFLNEFQDKIIFGADVCFGDEAGRRPHLAWLRELLSEHLISNDVFDKITGGNALEVLKLYDQ